MSKYLYDPLWTFSMHPAKFTVRSTSLCLRGTFVGQTCASRQQGKLSCALSTETSSQWSATSINVVDMPCAHTVLELAA